MTNETRFRPRSILAGVSEGTFSDDAVRAAVGLAKTYGASLELLHAVPTYPALEFGFSAADSAAVTADAVEASREVLTAHLSHQLGGVELDGKAIEELLRVEPGNPSRIVLDRAKELGADLIVLGDSGRKKQLDFGGAARGVLAKAGCPVWIQTRRPEPIERVLVPVDLSEHSLEALSAAVDLAERVGARVTALHCFSVREYSYVSVPYGPVDAVVPALDSVRESCREHFEEVAGGFDWRGVDHETQFVEEEPAHAVLARQYEHDLIVLGTHGRTGLAAALLGSVAYQILRAAHTPVLAIPMASRSWLLP